MKEYQFTCPKCNHHELGSVEQVILTYPITKIPDDGDLNYDTDDPTAGDGHVVAYQCLHCGFELKNEQGNTIQDCSEVVKWVKNNMSETDG